MPAPRTAKKSSTPTKVAVKAKGQKYEYTELAKVSLTATESTNVYGVIIDATFPYKVTADKYITSLKIVDPSLHSKGGKPTDNDWAQVVIYADKFEDLPIISKVGDIIRLHRANVRIHNGHRQFNVSIQQFSSWHPTQASAPVSKSTSPHFSLPLESGLVHTSAPTTV
jgi:hypothetical protein